jgi:hypothetical protein
MRCAVKGRMKLYTTDSLFPWERLQDAPDLQTIRLFFEALPAGRLLEALNTARGKGRDDYPSQVLLFCALLQPLLRHTTMSATLAELGRNPVLRKLGGMPDVADIPKPHNMSRFLARLGTEPFRTLLRQAFEQQVRRLGAAVPDLGVACAGDATHLSARPCRSQQAETDLPAPDGGTKSYFGEQGQIERTFSWFGYKLNLLCDARHEVALAYRITAASRPDNEALIPLVEQAQAQLPAGRLHTLAYDQAADDTQIHERLRERHVQPVIQQRSLWKQERERTVEGAGIGNVVHDEAGTIFCYDLISDPPVRHQMAYIGHEPKRGTLKYRCPAEHQSWRCPCAKRCNAGKRYGMTVRIKQETDLRRFPPIPRATKTFERLYKGRTAVERVNARLKVFWGVDDGNVAGGAAFHARVGLVMLAHVGLAELLAKAPRRDPGQRLGQTRLSPIARALAR